MTEVEKQKALKSLENDPNYQEWVKHCDRFLYLLYLVGGCMLGLILIRTFGV